MKKLFTKEALKATDKIIGANVREHRKAKYTMMEFLKLTGVSICTLSRWENGIDGIPSSKLASLAKVLRTDIKKFYKKKDD